jgi:nitrate reductase (NAD(P)H)
MMPEYHVGTLDKASLKGLKHDSEPQQDSAPREFFLQPRFWTKAELCKKVSVSHDTRIFTFALQHEKQALGLPTGQHLMLKVTEPASKTENILRAYTPTSQTDRLGTVELLVKIYLDTPGNPGGKMTMALDRLPVGSTVEFKGPIGKFTYLGKGRVLLNDKERKVKSFRMICGGSGITPIFQVLRAVMQDPEDPTTCVVLDGNRKEEDILCKTDLDSFAAIDTRKCFILHTLSSPSPSWAGMKGRISAQLLKEHASPEEDSLVLICGPEAMEKSAGALLAELGWDKSNIIFF